MHTQTITDPLDELIPPPRSWWVRLLVGLVIVTVVGVGAVLWGYGFVYPQPGCCGSASGSARMTLTADSQAVNVTILFDNSSGSDLTISGASAVLAGATVLDVAILDENDHTFPIGRITPLPDLIAATTSRDLVITFVPTSCHDDGRPWGKVSVRLGVVNDWLPSIDRTYTLPGPIVDAGSNELVVFPPEGLDNSTPTTPLAAACALLGRPSD